MSSSLFSSFQENTKCESSFFADTCTRRVPIFSQVMWSNYINVRLTFPISISDISNVRWSIEQTGMSIGPFV